MLSRFKSGYRNAAHKGAALVFGAALMVGAIPEQVHAQDQVERVAADTAWSVFVDGTPPECWATSAPSETLNTRGGQPAEGVARGDILLFATFRTGLTTPEISFTGGYPFDPNRAVNLEIGTNTFELFVDGTWAFAASPQDDAAIFAALRGGAQAVLRARSTRGTDTQDTFSLFGFTAASDEARRRCAS